MVEEFKGNSCKSARIKIDYSKKKPNVNFSYPSKNHQTNFSMLIPIYSFWALFIFILYVSYGSLNIDNLDNEIYGYNSSNYTACMVHYDSYCEKITNETPYVSITKYLFNLETLLALLILLVPPLFIYYPFKKKWANVFPVYQSLFCRKKLTTFKSKDVKKNNDGYYVELPVFENIILNYEATKDFSKYLHLFEIKEHNFKYVHKGKLKGVAKKKRELNEWIWYAKFYFTKKPLTGEISVLYV